MTKKQQMQCTQLTLKRTCCCRSALHAKWENVFRDLYLSFCATSAERRYVIPRI
jgi:hypothetical protein